MKLLTTTALFTAMAVAPALAQTTQPGRAQKLALDAGWDMELLVLELQGLIDIGVDVELTGFETAEIDILFEADAETKTDPGPEDHLPSPESGPAVSRPDDQWILGEHRL